MGRKKVTAYEAKTHLGQLLRDAESGQSFLIVRRGKPVARLEPAREDAGRDLNHLIEEVRRFRKSVRGTFSAKEIKGLINEGRRI